MLFNGVDLKRLPEPALARVRLTNMGFIFQQIHLLKHLSIFDNIVLQASGGQLQRVGICRAHMTFDPRS